MKRGDGDHLYNDDDDDGDDGGDGDGGMMMVGMG